VIDVTRDEPLPPDHPYWDCPNLILTQHSGGGSASEQNRKLDVFESNFRRFCRGEPIKGIVTLAKGY